jgi:hypothetical protein
MSSAPTVGSSNLRVKKGHAQRYWVRWISDAESDVTLSPCDSWGTGVPTHTAVTNSLYYRTDATAGNAFLYRNTDGGTTWVAVSGIVEATDGVIPISHISFTAVSGVWTRSRSAAANYVITRTAAATTEALAVEVPTISLRSTANKGRKIVGLRIKYSIATAAANDVTVSVAYTTVPANASAVAAASTLGTITYDAAHDTAAERKTVAEHTMSVAFGSPVYLADAVGFEILVTVDAALTTVFKVWQIELLTTDILVDTV